MFPVFYKQQRESARKQRKDDKEEQERKMRKKKEKESVFAYLYLSYLLFSTEKVRAWKSNTSSWWPPCALIHTWSGRNERRAFRWLQSTQSYIVDLS